MKRLGIFLVTTFVSTWVIGFGLIYANNHYDLNPLIVTGVMAICMLFPAICSIITRLVTKEGFKNLGLRPNLKGNKKNIKYYLLAWFLPSILIILGAVIYFCIFPQSFDGGMTSMLQQYQNVGVEMSFEKLRTIAIIETLVAIFLAPLLNLIPCLGEELGWRGYLLPKLTEHYSYVSSILISGIIWGLWHAPFIIMGHNYGVGYTLWPLGGIIAMTIFCILFGAFSSYITIKSKSVLPAAITHGSLNGLVAISTFFVFTDKANPFIGPLPTGLIGGIGIIITGIICIILTSKMANDKQDIFEIRKDETTNGN